MLKSTQQAYDLMISHFSHREALLAVDVEAERCMYRTADGQSCAVGCLLPDELYDPSMEGEWAGAVLDHNPEIERYFSQVELQFLLDAQNLHDVVAFDEGAGATELFITRLQNELGGKYKLRLKSGTHSCVGDETEGACGCDT